MANLGPGIGLLFFGLLLAAIGGSAYSGCSGQAPFAGVTPDCSGFLLLTGLGILLIVIGVAVLVYRASARTTRIQEVPDPSIPPPIIRPVIIQQTIVQGTSRVQCPFCSATYDSSAGRCPSCGAPEPLQPQSGS